MRSLLRHRRHLIELHEQAWFPEVWRDLFRAGLGKAFVLFGLSQELSRGLSHFLDVARPTEVLDLCSGSGEVSVDAWRSAQAGRERYPASLFLSDLFPDINHWSQHSHDVGFIASRVDMHRLGGELPRVRMMLNSLHHMSPEELHELLHETARSADGFFASDRNARNWREMFLTVCVVPIAAAFITAFVIRPFRLRNVLWGLIIPVIPLVALFDGLVSNLRSYTVDELRLLVMDGPSTFIWEVGETPGGRGVPAMTYVIGIRRQAAPR